MPDGIKAFAIETPKTDDASEGVTEDPRALVALCKEFERELFRIERTVDSLHDSPVSLATSLALWSAERKKQR